MNANEFFPFFLLSQHKKKNKKHVSNVEKSIRHTTFAFFFIELPENVQKYKDICEKKTMRKS